MEAGYCYEKGIPYEEFLERWSPKSRAVVAAVAMEKGQECGRCGTAGWEWDEDANAYVAIRVLCPGCQRIKLMEEDEANAPGLAGSSIRLVPLAAAERLRAQKPETVAERRARRLKKQGDT